MSESVMAIKSQWLERLAHIRRQNPATFMDPLFRSILHKVLEMLEEANPKLVWISLDKDLRECNTCFRQRELGLWRGDDISCARERAVLGLGIDERGLGHGFA